MSVAAYAEYKDSGVEWLGAVPAHWDVCALNYRFEIDLGKMLDEKRITGDHLGSYLRNTDVQWGRVNTEDLPVMDFSGADLTRYALLKGDLLVCEGGEIGRAAVWDGQLSPCFYQKALHRLRPRRPDRDCPRFTLYLFSTAAKLGVFAGGEGRSTIAHLPAETLRRYRMCFPPPHEQTAIASFLDRETGKIDVLVEEQRRLIALLKEKRQAVISDAVTKGLDPNAPMKDSGVEWLGEVPAHWTVAKAKRFLTVVSGFAFPSDRFSQDANDVRLLRGINIGVSKVRWDDTVYWARLPDDGLGAFSLVPGQLVIGMDRPWIGDGLRIAMLSEDDVPALLLQRVAALNPASDVEASFLFLLFSAQSFFHHCFPDMTGVSVPHISPTQIGDYSIAMPPPAEQRAIVDFYRRQDSNSHLLLAEAEAAVSLLQERRAALISAAVTGKIDVRGTVPVGAVAA